jgi:hypothetical protein
MAIRIVDIKLTPGSSWDDITGLADWNAVKNTNISWQVIIQSVIVGHSVKIEVEVTEGKWDSVKELITSWSTVKTKFTNWSGLKNW